MPEPYTRNAEIAEKYGMKVNSDEERVTLVQGRLLANVMKYGRPYCPCMPIQTEDTVCPCRYMREKKACRCGLYQRKDD